MNLYFMFDYFRHIQILLNLLKKQGQQENEYYYFAFRKNKAYFS